MRKYKYISILLKKQFESFFLPGDGDRDRIFNVLKKRRGYALSLLAAFLSLIGASGLHAQEKKFCLKITGGISSFVLGDVNAYIEDTLRFKADDLESAGYVIDRELEKFHAGRDIEISILIPIAQHFHLTIGSGYLSAEKENNTYILNSSFSTLTGILNHTVKAIPISLGIHYSLRVSTKSRLYLFSSGEFYFSKFLESGEQRLDLKSGFPGYDHTWDAETKATGLGFSGGLGFELGLSSNISFLIEAKGRFARISGFSGTGTSRYDSSKDELDIHLYYYEFTVSALEDSYRMLDLPNADHGFPLAVLRDAVIDLSGFSLKAGIKIGL